MEKKKILLICGNDKLSRKLISQIPDELEYQLAIDTSTNFQRVFKLLLRKRISLNTLFQIAMAELLRNQYRIDHPFTQIKTNREIEDLVKNGHIDTTLLFRASIIINERLINSGIEIINTHCAKIPQYAGLGAISKAIEIKDLDQEATLHHVAKKIDAGRIIAVKQYQLSPGLSYQENENIAYNAGIDLVIEFMKSKLGTS